MCTGGGGSTTTVQKSDPLPTAVTDVTSANTNADAEANRKQRRKRGNANNIISTDRGTILGGLTDQATSSRNTLG